MGQSRMERNKEIHAAVRKEIAYKKNVQDEKSIIYSTFERLKKIDPEFFKEKLEIFDAKHQFEKPYLDKDKSSSLFPEDIKFELKMEIADLNKVGVKDEPPKLIEEDDEKIDLKKEKFIKLYENLLRNEANFKKNIEKLKEKQSRPINNQDIDMKTVQQLRSRDNRDTQQMIVDVNEKNEKAYGNLTRLLKTNEKKHRFKWALPVLIVLIIIMVLAIIIPIFLV